MTWIEKNDDMVVGVEAAAVGSGLEHDPVEDDRLDAQGGGQLCG